VLTGNTQEEKMGKAIKHLDADKAHLEAVIEAEKYTKEVTTYTAQKVLDLVMEVRAILTVSQEEGKKQ
jgi:hypothetical protein